MRYKWEHGRRYHAYQDGSYWFVDCKLPLKYWRHADNLHRGPNDQRQLDAEDFV